MKKIVTSALILVLAFATFAAQKTMLFGKSDNGKTVTVPVGKTFRIELASNPTTGFDWHLEGLDTKILKVTASGFNPPNSKLVGAGGIDWWEVKTLKPGSSKLCLLYYRVWEGKGKAVDRYTLRLNVLPKEK